MEVTIEEDTYKIQKKIFKKIIVNVKKANLEYQNGNVTSAILINKSNLNDITTSVIYDKLHLDTKKVLVNYAYNLARKITSMEHSILDINTNFETQRNCTNQYVDNYFLLHELFDFWKKHDCEELEETNVDDHYTKIGLKFLQQFEEKYKSVVDLDIKVGLFTIGQQKKRIKIIQGKKCGNTNNNCQDDDIMLITDMIRSWNERIENNHIEHLGVFNIYKEKDEIRIKLTKEEYMATKIHQIESDSKKLENASPEEKEDFAVSKMLMNCVLDCSNAVGFEEIVGLEVTKNNLRTAMEQILHYQQLIRLQIITPQSGCLMYGPSGTGKTMLAMALGKEAKDATFIKINASDLFNKYVGGSEKRLKAIFQIAEDMSPTILFIDEIDGIMTQKNDKNLTGVANVLLDLTTNMAEKKNFLIGCTNYPQNMDKTYYRRFSKRVYVPLPNEQERLILFQKLLSKQQHQLSNEEICKLAVLTEFYTPAEITQVVAKATYISWEKTKTFTYFKPTIFKSGFFTPCLKGEAFSLQVQYHNIPKDCLLPLPFVLKDLLLVLKTQPPSTTETTLQELKEWMKINNS